MLPYDKTPALASRARLAARAVLGLVLEEQRAARFVYEYSTTYFRQGIAGEAEHKAELLAAIERESLLLVTVRIERSLARAAASRVSRLGEPDGLAAFLHGFLTFLGGSLAWDRDEREAFRKDLAMYLRLAARESRPAARRPGALPLAGAFVDRCAFLVDPSMMAQAREAAARYQVQLESCADQALRAAFRGFRLGAATPAARQRPRPKPKAKPKPKPKPKPRRKPKRKPKSRPKPKAKPKPKSKAPSPRRRSPRRPIPKRPGPKPKAPVRRRAKPSVRPRPRPKPRQKPRPKPGKAPARRKAPRRARPSHRPTPRRAKAKPASRQARPVRRTPRKPSRKRPQK